MEPLWDALDHLNTPQAISILKSHDLFKRMSEAEIAQLAEKCVLTTLERRQVLIKQGDPSVGFYFVVSGMIKLYRQRSENLQTVVRFVPPSASFGEATIFQYDPYPVSASACVPSQVLHVPTDKVIAKMKSSWEFCAKVLKLLCLRLKEQMEKVEYLTMPSIRLRYAFFLDQERSAATVHNVNLISLTMSGKEIATHLGTSPESVSRVFNDFIERQIVTHMKDRLYSLDRTKLYELIEQELSEH